MASIKFEHKTKKLLKSQLAVLQASHCGQSFNYCNYAKSISRPYISHGIWKHYVVTYFFPKCWSMSVLQDYLHIKVSY